MLMYKVKSSGSPRLPRGVYAIKIIGIYDKSFLCEITTGEYKGGRFYIGHKSKNYTRNA